MLLFPNNMNYIYKYIYIYHLFWVENFCLVSTSEVFLPDVFLLPDKHGLEFYINVCDISTNQSRERARILCTSWNFMLLPETFCIEERVANEHTQAVS